MEKLKRTLGSRKFLATAAGVVMSTTIDGIPPAWRVIAIALLIIAYVVATALEDAAHATGMTVEVLRDMDITSPPAGDELEFELEVIEP